MWSLRESQRSSVVEKLQGVGLPVRGLVEPSHLPSARTVTDEIKAAEMQTAQAALAAKEP